MSRPTKRSYAKSHEWVYLDRQGDAKVATVGISAFAVEALTDLVHIELPATGRKVKSGDALGEIESVKAVSDLYSPVHGEVIEVNPLFTKDPATVGNCVRQEPVRAARRPVRRRGWLVKRPAGRRRGARPVARLRRLSKAMAGRRTLSRLIPPEIRLTAAAASFMSTGRFVQMIGPALPPRSSMPYIANTAEDQRAMLEAIGVDSLDDLFSPIPPELRLGRALDIPPALTELELTRRLTSLAGKNQSADQKVCFLGGGSDDDHSFRRWSTRSARAVNSIPRTRPINRRPARETCKSFDIRR